MPIKEFPISRYHSLLSAWFRGNKRDLPWRRDGHWYKIFLSEFLLQQTRVDQALPYFTKFINTYPDIHALAGATEQDILSLWAGLGYYTRGRNLLRAARQIVARHDGEFPLDYRTALSLPGIGPYTAAAILSIAFNQPQAVVDGNVIRVMSRLFALKDDVRQSRSRSKIQVLAGQLIDALEPGPYNEAVMELGATLCKPRNALCGQCPLETICRARKNGQVSNYPYKTPARPKNSRTDCVFVIRQQRKLLFVKRPPGGLLASMWEFPLIAVDRFPEDAHRAADLLAKHFSLEITVPLLFPVMAHTYSHIHLRYVPVSGKYKSGSIQLSGYEDAAWLDINEAKNIPVHRAHTKIIQQLNDLV